jgi:hypothetical protein
MTTPSSNIMTDALAGEIVQQTKLYLNVNQDAIVITEDKVRLCLIQHLSKLEARRDWLAPAGIFLTLAVTFPTTTFHDAVVSAATWQAVFVIVTALDLAWLVRTVWRAWRSPKLEDVVASMKRDGASAAGSTAPARDA